MKRTLLGVLALGCAAGTWTACVGDDSTTPPADSGADVTIGDAQPEAGAPALSASPASVTVVVGKSAMSTITLDRQSLQGAVTITVSGAPSGVTATAAPIASNQTTTTLQVAAAANATEGASTLTLKASGVPDLSVPLLVAGPPGSLDPSWDNDGFVIDTTSATGVFYALAVQSDGAVIAVGATAPSGGKWLVRRFDGTGKPDAAFDTAAASAIPLGGAARAVKIDPTTSKIVVGGDNGATADQMAIVRLNPDGSPDQAFANAGTYTPSNVDFSQGSNANGLVVRSDSTIVVAGNTISNSLGFVFGLDATGVADSKFVRFTTLDKGSLNGIVELAGGALLAGGTDSTLAPPAALAVRLTANGSPDLSFGSGGVRTYPTPTAGMGMTATANGDALIVGTDVKNNTGFAELRFAASGTGDTVWAQTFAQGSSARFRGAAAGANDATYAAGWYSGTYDSAATLERRLANGSLDTTFGDAGGTLTFEDPGTPDGYAYQFFCVATSSDGRVLVGGSRSIGGTGAVILRVWP